MPNSTTTAQSSKKRTRNMWNSSGGSSRASSFSKKRGSSTYRPNIDDEAAEKLFADIADDDDPTAAGMEGISTLCDKLEIDPLEDIRILVLLWKMGSKEKPAQITKEEWMAGCQKLQVDSIEKLKALLPSLETGFLDRNEFRDFYKVCMFQKVSLLPTFRKLPKVPSHQNIYISLVLLPLQSSRHSSNFGQGNGSGLDPNDFERSHCS